jgi:hypothetical protein
MNFHGSYECASEGTMITKRSYHIPMFTKIEMRKKAFRLAGSA